MLHKEQGSSFHIFKESINRIDKNPILPNFYGDALFVSTCRNAINIVIDSCKLEGKVILVPPFTCYAVLEPFLKHNCKLIPYKVDSYLNINLEELKQNIKCYAPSAMIVHSYFGIDTLKNVDEFIVTNELNREMIIIEDRTHSMFSDFYLKSADYYIGSIRKWLPIPDGGFLYPLKDIDMYHIEEDTVLVDKGIRALNQKAIYLSSSDTEQQDSRMHIQLFAELENYIDEQVGIYKMSTVAKGVLMDENWTCFSEKRRNNYNTLFESIKFNDFIQPSLGRACKNETPFMFPLYVKKDRRVLQQYMVRRSIFPTVIWGCPENISNTIDDEARRVYEEILCLPCDQRYDLEDMLKISDCINEFYEGKE